MIRFAFGILAVMAAGAWASMIVDRVYLLESRGALFSALVFLGLLGIGVALLLK